MNFTNLTFLPLQEGQIRKIQRDPQTYRTLFEFYEFDLSASAGRAIITKLNGQNAQYTAELKDGDVIELAWKEK